MTLLDTYFHSLMKHIGLFLDRKLSWNIIPNALFEKCDVIKSENTVLNPVLNRDVISPRQVEAGLAAVIRGLNADSCDVDLGEL